MKKQRIAEAVYFAVALLFIGLCIGSGKEAEKEVFGTGVTATPSSNPEERLPETTASPVRDSIPTSEDEETPAEEKEKNPIPGTEDDPAQESNMPITGHPDGTGEIDDKEPGLTQEPSESGHPTDVPDKIGVMPGAIDIVDANYEQYPNEKKAWWFRRNTEHKPSGSGEEFPIADYSAFYLDKEATEEDKVIYLTFDCGYENGFTPTILDTLAEKDVKVMFFVTKDFIVKNPDYVKRMKAEGHLVGNHTVRHLSSPSMTAEELEAELYEVAKVMEELTGYRIDPFFRPPMGEYSKRTLKVTQDMGYTSVFWSIAYYDYDVNDQPGKEYVVDHFTTYHHNGSIVLMHNTSESNAQALGDVVDLLKEAGYRFGELTELTE